MRYVSCSRFDANRLSIVENDDKSRKILKYNYLNFGMQDLRLALDKDCYLKSGGLFKEKYQNVETWRHSIALNLDLQLEGHQKMYKTLKSIYKMVTRIENEKEINFPLSKTDNSSHVLYCRIVEGKDGTIYTSCTDKEKEKIDLKTLGPCFARPMLSFSYPITNLNHYNIKITIAEMVIDSIIEKDNSILDENQDEPEI